MWSSIQGDTVGKSDRSVGVEHHSESGAHSSGGEVSGELSSNGAVVAVGLDDPAPDRSEFGVVSNTLGLVNISDPLAKVKACVLLIIHTLDLKEGKLLVLSALASLESSEHGLRVQSKWAQLNQRSYLTGCPLVWLFACFSASFPIFI